MLLEEMGGSFILAKERGLYNDFHRKIEKLLKPEDYEPFDRDSEPRWQNRFRWALKHMRQDGRVRYLHHGQYEITEAGRSYLRTTVLPLELLVEEVEKLENGQWRIRYLNPDGSVECEFGGGLLDKIM